MKPISKQPKCLKLWAIEMKCESEFCISMNFIRADFLLYLIIYFARHFCNILVLSKRTEIKSLTVSLGSKQAETFTDKHFTKINLTECSRRKTTNLLVWKILRSAAADVYRIIALTSISIMSVRFNPRAFLVFYRLNVKSDRVKES